MRGTPLGIRYNNSRWIVLWMDSEESYDSEIYYANGQLMAFTDLQSTIDYARDHGIVLEKEADITVELDSVITWMNLPPAEAIPVELILNVLNFLDDAMPIGSEREDFRGNSAERDVYDKVFHANNLPAITPVNEKYIPIWSDNEIKILCRILQNGISHFVRVCQMG